MNQEEAIIAGQCDRGGGYRELVLASPRIAATVRPGQFVHLRIPDLHGAVLRRPFSIYRAAGDNLHILYKNVGLGTTAMNRLEEGRQVSILGPLGNGFPLELNDRQPVLVAGGYGVAPLYYLAEKLREKGRLLVGGRTAQDILLIDEFTKLGWQVEVATDDGSSGRRGMVTVLLDELLDTAPAGRCVFYACGPDGMLKALAERALAHGLPAWLSLDKHMGCGVGACLACVTRIRTDDGSESWKRVCKDGPVFAAREVVWE